MRVFPRHTVNLDASAYVTYFKHLKDATIVEGPEVAAFERSFAQYIGAPMCIGVSSARAGFYLALKGLGVGSGDEVIMPAYNFPSMPAAVIATGARPVFVDADPETFNIDPALAAKAVTQKTAAIVATHLFGRAAEMEPLVELAEANESWLIEDCAHAAGTIYKGARVGTFGDAAVFSFGVGKNMPCFGGGAITMRDRELAGKVRKFVNNAGAPDELDIHRKVWSALPPWAATRPWVFPWTMYVAERVLDTLGSDAIDEWTREPLSKMTRFSLRSLGRMANLEAAVALDQLGKIHKRNATLARNGRYLAEALADVPTIQAPAPVEGEEHIYLYFRVLVPEARRFRSMLLKRGIDTQSDDMADCAALDAFKVSAADCPVAASLPEKSIELPNNVFLSRGDLDYIAAAVKDVAKAVSDALEAGGKRAK